MSLSNDIFVNKWINGGSAAVGSDDGSVRCGYGVRVDGLKFESL